MQDKELEQKRSLQECLGGFIHDGALQELAAMIRVKEMIADRGEGTITVEAECSQLLEASLQEQLTREIEEGMLHQYRVVLHMSLAYSGQSGDEEQETAAILEDAWVLALQELQNDHKLHAMILNRTDPDFLPDGRVIVRVPMYQAKVLQHNGFLKHLEEDLGRMIGRRVRVLVEGTAVEHDAVTHERELKRREAEALSAVITGEGSMPAETDTIPADSGEMLAVEPLPWEEQPEAVPACDTDAAPLPEAPLLTEEELLPAEEFIEEEEEEAPRDEVLFGKAIHGKIQALGGLKDNRRTVLHGILASAAEKDIQDGSKVLLTMVLTDYQNETTVKSFIPKPQYKAFADKIKPGITLLVKGTAHMDDYAHEVALIANHITLCSEAYQVDPEVLKAMEEMIIGMPFEPVNERPLKNIEALNGEVTVQGEVILMESKEDRTGRLGLTIDITDYSGSIAVFARTDKERFKAIAGDFKAGRTIQVLGELEDEYKSGHRMIRASAIRRIKKNFRPERVDTAAEKRVELHMHTKMSEMDAVSSPSDLVKQAARWGHPAVAITDHGVVQGFPEAMEAAEKLPIKVIYGVEAYLVDDLQEAVRRDHGQDMSASFVVFDIETTGFNKEKDRIIEIGAVKIHGEDPVERFSSFIDPGMPIPEHIVKLTSITDDDVRGCGSIEEVLPRFLEFCGDSCLVAHNASFDTGFIEAKARDLGLPPIENTVVDTLALARGLYQLPRYTLDSVCRHLGISLENHHRAVDDAEACAGIFAKGMEALAEQKVEKLADINAYIRSNMDIKRLRPFHAIILVRNLTGLRNLYELVSIAHLQYFYRFPKIPKSAFNRLREGLLLGSACEAGELFQAVLDEDGPEAIERIVNEYDYLEIQPICNNEFLIRNKTVPDRKALEDINRRIVALGEQYDKPVVATCDVHFLNPEDGIFRKIILAGKGFEDADLQADMYFRTTDEMLREFAYLGEEKAKEVVITNTNRIADMIEKIKPIPDGTFTPEIEGANDELVQITHQRAKELYGDPLPEPVKARLDRELGSIIKNGFASLYIIAERLVKHSNADGYVVGSRGSVGSSFVATMAGITEVNPLKPHYHCPECRYSEFDSEEIRANAGKSGFDLPDKVCPRCGTMLAKDGHDIPFETFLGFDGDKEPDIDLNFSGEYQPRAHAFTEELFGKEQVFRAGTMGGLADKTAYGYVKKYLEEHHMDVNRAEISRLVAGCTGVRRTTGQHPGGQMVVPKGYSIYQFCPVQYPANKAEAGTITTHFDYHQLHGRLLKLDILGHDDPTMIRMLMDLTGVDAMSIPIDNPQVLSLFLGTEALGVTPEQIGSPTGTFGVPEFGTRFTRQMLVDTKPQSFSDLVRISGLSHGTDVWNNNAQDLIRDGVATISEVICTRDDIMTYLIRHGLDNLYSFKLMEAVRKGRGLTPDDEKNMAAAGVPEWYIKSCQKIKYLFPKGHATAYVMMALRVAYYKVFYKEAYYAAFFSIRATGFDYETMCFGEQQARAEKARIEALGKEATDKDKDEVTTLELVIEAYCRGVQFDPISLEHSGAERFKITPEGHLLPPFTTLPGMGASAARSIVEAREASPILTVDDLATRAKVSKTHLELMRRLHILDELPESMQMSLF